MAHRRDNLSPARYASDVNAVRQSNGMTALNSPQSLSSLLAAANNSR